MRNGMKSKKQKQKQKRKQQQHKNSAEGNNWRIKILWNCVQYMHIPQHTEAETNGPRFADDIFQIIFLSENYCILIQFH